MSDAETIVRIRRLHGGLLRVLGRDRDRAVPVAPPPVTVGVEDVFAEDGELHRERVVARVGSYASEGRGSASEALVGLALVLADRYRSLREALDPELIQAAPMDYETGVALDLRP